MEKLLYAREGRFLHTSKASVYVSSLCYKDMMKKDNVQPFIKKSLRIFLLCNNKLMNGTFTSCLVL